MKLINLELIDERNMVYRAHVELNEAPWWKFWTDDIKTSVYINSTYTWYNAATGTRASRTLAKFLGNEIRKQQIQDILKEAKPNLREV